MTSPEESTATSINQRRHDLDALRGFAMLLGIVLHAGMSFLPGIKPIWGVEDIHSSTSFSLMNHIIHGWRMQLFFFISGFFTMMLWRKRGSKALFVHRVKRIFIPLLLAMATVTPCWWVAQGYVRENDKQRVELTNATTFADQGPVEKSNHPEHLANATVQDDNEINPWASIFSDDAITLQVYLENGGDKNQIDPSSGSSLLHAACFYGKLETAAVLINAKADRKAKNKDGLTPMDLLSSDWETTKWIGSLTGIELEQEKVQSGRKGIAELFATANDRAPDEPNAFSETQEHGETEGFSRREDYSSIQKSGLEIDLFVAVISDNLDDIETYLDRGGEVNLVDPSNGSSPLHAACFFGKARAAEALINAGAKLDATNNDGQMPHELLFADWGITQTIAGLLKIQVDAQDIELGRKQIARIISERTGKPPIVLPDLADQAANAPGPFLQFLRYFPAFNHLWFLWFLCWFVILFIAMCEMARAIGWTGNSPSWIHSSLRYALLIPVTAIPQFFMARMPNAFGPDTSVAILPPASIFIYYLIFFFAGSIYFNSPSQHRPSIFKVSALMMLSLITFAGGLMLISPSTPNQRMIFSLLQSAYAWFMTFGMIGIFSYGFSKERYWARYLSDSSYWLYLAHLPLVLLLQDAVEDWVAPSALKFSLVTISTTCILLLSYHLLVRNTWIGVILNGRRYPKQSS